MIAAATLSDAAALAIMALAAKQECYIVDLTTAGVSFVYLGRNERNMRTLAVPFRCSNKVRGDMPILESLELVGDNSSP